MTPIIGPCDWNLFLCLQQFILNWKYIIIIIMDVNYVKFKIKHKNTFMKAHRLWKRKENVYEKYLIMKMQTGNVKEKLKVGKIMKENL